MSIMLFLRLRYQVSVNTKRELNVDFLSYQGRDEEREL